MPGAIGVMPYVDPLRRPGSSLSVSQAEDDLRRFIALPRHVASMRAYRDRVSMRAVTWTTERFDTEGMGRTPRAPGATATNW
jgi:hypothetical protein